VLLDRGHEVAFMVRLDPLDDVHDAGLEFFARLHDPVRGVDSDSRLPEARDRAARYRFVPVEHASIVLPGKGGDGRPRRPTSSISRCRRAGRPPPSRSAATAWCERAKALIRAHQGDAATCSGRWPWCCAAV
jgi:hypothetical protein